MQGGGYWRVRSPASLCKPIDRPNNVATATILQRVSIVTEEPAHAPIDIEQPACFYLGREFDPATGAGRSDRPVMYDARDLTTHGVIVGMTGSGTTGLAIALLEEAAIDGIPCVLIDPKGDLTNLLLQFLGLEPSQFEPWVNEDDARQKG